MKNRCILFEFTEWFEWTFFGIHTSLVSKKKQEHERKEAETRGQTKSKKVFFYRENGLRLEIDWKGFHFFSVVSSLHFIFFFSWCPCPLIPLFEVIFSLSLECPSQCPLHFILIPRGMQGMPRVDLLMKKVMLVVQLQYISLIVVQFMVSFYLTNEVPNKTRIYDLIKSHGRGKISS